MRYCLWLWGVLSLISFLWLPTTGCTSNKEPWTASEAWHRPVAPEGEDWSYDGVEGQIIQTEHFKIYTTVGDGEILEKLPVFLETAYQRYRAYLPPAEVDEQPLELYLFARRYEWEKYTRENLGPLAEDYLKIRAGAYSYKGIAVAYLLERYQTFGVLAHEGFHQFSNFRLQHRIPAWMEEGLACNFEAHFWRGGVADFSPDLNEFRISALKRAVRRNSLFELDELITMDAGHAVSLPAEGTATYYAQVWALTRFLQEAQGGKYRAGFKQLLIDATAGANLYSQKRAAEVFQSYFKQDIEELTGEFRDYASLLAYRRIRSGMQVTVIGLDEPVRTITITETQIEQPEPLPQEEPPPAPQPQPDTSQTPGHIHQPPPEPVVPEIEPEPGLGVPPPEPVVPEPEPAPPLLPELEPIEPDGWESEPEIMPEQPLAPAG